MKPLQVYLPETDLSRLERWAEKRGWTKSQAVRVALRALVREDADDPLLGASGMIEGLPADLSTRIDAYISETFVAESAPGYRKTKRTRKRRDLRR
jgi:hypothetical protein